MTICCECKIITFPRRSITQEELRGALPPHPCMSLWRRT